MRLLSLSVAALLGVLAACGLTGPDQRDGSRPFDGRGRYTVGFEASLFRPCGDDQQWWVTSLDSVPVVQSYVALHQRSDARPGEDYVTAFVSWRGVRSGAGHFGNLDGYPYAFQPQETHEVRDTTPSDCP